MASFALEMARDKQRQLEAAARIRELRGPKPQPVVADELGVRLRTYQHWEAGDGIAWENLQNLARLYGVTENYILYGDETPRGAVSQLDRIERTLALILSRLPDPEEELEREQAEAARQAPQRAANNAASARTARHRAKAR